MIDGGTLLQQETKNQHPTILQHLPIWLWLKTLWTGTLFKNHLETIASSEDMGQKKNDLDTIQEFISEQINLLHAHGRAHKWWRRRTAAMWQSCPMHNSRIESSLWCHGTPFPYNWAIQWWLGYLSGLRSGPPNTKTVKSIQPTRHLEFFLHPLTSVGKIWSVYGTWLSGPQNQTYPYSLNTWSANTPEGVFFRDDNDDDDNNNSSSNNSRSIPGKRPRKAHGMKSLCSGFPPSIFPSIGLYL